MHEKRPKTMLTLRMQVSNLDARHFSLMPFCTRGEDAMRTSFVRWLMPVMALVVLFAGISATAQPSLLQARFAMNRPPEMQKTDTLGVSNLSSFDDMARRVDSLQFIVVYNYELLQRDVGTKVLWIYVMLGVMIVATFAMYGAFRQVYQSRRDLEEKFASQLSYAVSHLESEIRSITSKVEPPKAKPQTKPKKKKS